MTVNQVTALSLVAVGAALIGWSAFWGFRTRRLVLPGLQGKWLLLVAFMVSFVAGYAFFAYVIVSGAAVPLDVFTSIVFLGGGAFVYIVMKLSYTTVLRLNRKEEETQTYLGELIDRTDDLEQEIAERYRIVNELRESERFLSTIFDSINDPFCIFDRSFRIVRANEQYTQIKGRTVEDTVGKVCYELEGRSTPCDDCLVEKTIRSKDPCAKEKKGGNQAYESWYELFSYPILDERGEVSHVIEYTRDITDRKRLEGERKSMLETLEHLSRTDQLTGLLNRRGLNERLGDEMERARRYASRLTIILGDVDYFKKINDEFGHAIGDLALKNVAETITGMLRKSDIAGRYGGDEVMIIMPETGPEGARIFAQRINERLARGRLVADTGRPVQLSLSLGVAGYRPEMRGIDDFIMLADKALYESKDRGRSRVTVSAPPGSG